MSYFPPSIDSLSGAMKVIELEHAKTHSGLLFSASDLQTLGGSATYKYLISQGVAPANHLFFEFAGNAEGRIALYENPTTPSGGSAWTPYNHNRNSAIVSAVVLTRGISTVADGTLLYVETIGTSGGGAKGSGATRGAHEYILKLSTDYVLVVTAVAAGNFVTSVDFYVGGTG